MFLSHFTKALRAQRLSGVFVHPALDTPALDCGGAKLIAGIGAMPATMPLYAPKREDLSTPPLGASEIVKLDPEGRFVLSDRRNRARALRADLASVT